MRGMILCLLFWFLGAGIWVGGFWGGDPMMMMMDLVRFYSSRGFLERCVGWMREKGGFSFFLISGGIGRVV